MRMRQLTNWDPILMLSSRSIQVSSSFDMGIRFQMGFQPFEKVEHGPNVRDVSNLCHLFWMLSISNGSCAGVKYSLRS